jgi:L-ascorbate metabolism protein UlaG (beta-lactamase superfamily)
MNTARRAILRGALALGGSLALGGGAMQAMAAAPAKGKRQAVIRWMGGGVAELATPDYKQIAYADSWIWNNAGWSRFNVPKPAEYATKEGFAKYVADKKPEAVFALLTHDHGDHMGDYFEMLSVLSAAGLPLKTTGQSDLMRNSYAEAFKKAGLDPAKLVVNNGAGMNFGGTTRHGAMTAHLVSALHSNLSKDPAAGFILDIGGVRIYVSGDTDLMSDLKVIGERYKPDVAVVCIGGGPFTMGPDDAATACRWLGVSHAIPVHYAHNPMVLGVEAGAAFRAAMAKRAPKASVTVLKPGESKLISL